MVMLLAGVYVTSAEGIVEAIAIWAGVPITRFSVCGAVLYTPP